MTLARAAHQLLTKTSRSVQALLVIMATWCQGCSGGTETGNPPFPASLSYVGYSSQAERIGVLKPGRELFLRHAWLDLASVNLSANGDCGLREDDSFTLPGLGVGDHAAGVHVVTSFEATPAAFCRLALPFVRADAPASGPSELAGNSILLLGELPDATPVSIASRFTPVVSLEAAEGGFRIAPEQARLLLAFDFAIWLEDLDLVTAERSQGVLRIDGEHNVGLLQAFERNLSRGVSLHRDGDGDGALDPGSVSLAQAR